VDQPIHQLPGSTGEQSNQHESSLAINPTNVNNWVVVFMDDIQEISTCRNRLGATCCGFACHQRVRVLTTQNILSPGGGWLTPYDPPFTLMSGDATQYDPVITFDGTGRVCLVYCERAGSEKALFSIRSLDGGLTWSAPFNVSGTFTDRSMDKPWMVAQDHLATCTASCPVFGAPCMLYLTWGQLSLPNSEIMFRSSSDGGLNWSPTVQISAPPFMSGANYLAPNIATSANRVYVAWVKRLGAGQAQLYINRSLDCGATWLPQELAGFTYSEINQLSPPPTIPGRAGVGPYSSGTNNCDLGNELQFSIPSIAAIGDSVFVVWTEHLVSGNCRRARAKYNSSANQGTTWTWTSGFPEVSDAPSDRETFSPAIVGYPGTTNLFVAFYDKRNSPSSNIDRQFDLYGTATNCAAAGCIIAWAPAVRLSTAPPNPPAHPAMDPFFALPDPVTAPSFFGHYNGLAMYLPTLAAATWTDCKNGSIYPGHTSTWQDVWWNFYYLCSDSSAQSSPPSFSASAGGTLLLSFPVPREGEGLRYRIVGGWALAPSRLIGRRWVPVAEDDLSRAIEERRGITHEGFDGVLTARPPDMGDVSLWHFTRRLETVRGRSETQSGTRGAIATI